MDVWCGLKAVYERMYCSHWNNRGPFCSTETESEISESGICRRRADKSLFVHGLIKIERSLSKRNRNVYYDNLRFREYT